MEAIEIRRQEPDDATALHGVYSQPKVIHVTTAASIATCMAPNFQYQMSSHR